MAIFLKSAIIVKNSRKRLLFKSWGNVKMQKITKNGFQEDNVENWRRNRRSAHVEKL
jgi:hypothetical protein